MDESYLLARLHAHRPSVLPRYMEFEVLQRQAMKAGLHAAENDPLPEYAGVTGTVRLSLLDARTSFGRFVAGSGSQLWNQDRRGMYLTVDLETFAASLAFAQAAEKVFLRAGVAVTVEQRIVREA